MNYTTKNFRLRAPTSQIREEWMTGLIRLKKYSNEAAKMNGGRKSLALETSPSKRSSLAGSLGGGRASHSFKNGHKFIDPTLLSKICSEKEGKEY